MADGEWRQLDKDDDAKVRVVKVRAKSESALGQRLVSDPLGALIDSPQVGNVDGTWRVISVGSNAHIPTGPLPLPHEVEADSAGSGDMDPWVIRKIIVHYVIYEETQEIVIAPRRYDPATLITREMVVGVLENSLKKRLTK